MSLAFVPLDVETHADDLFRVLQECGWLRSDQRGVLDDQLACATVWVGELSGRAEAAGMTMPGTLRYLKRDLPLGVVTAVVTGRAGRRRGLAGGVTVRAMRSAVEQGAAVLALGVFDRGFYDKLGFGSGPDDLRVSFDPSRLRVEGRPRVPEALSLDDYQAIHACRLARWRRHGAVSLTPDRFTREFVQLEGGEHRFGLGYRDAASGALTHLVWLDTDDLESGPYRVSFVAFQTREQFLELMGLIRSLGDQVALVRMFEPAGIRLEDLVPTPFRERWRTKGSKYAAGVEAYAWWQMRIADLPACLAATHLDGGSLRFNLELEDPVESRLPDGGWRGVGGSWVVELARQSSAERSRDEGLLTLTASVGAFTRLWLGVGPATGLAATDALAGPNALLEALDDVLRLPLPRVDWEF